MFVVTLNKKTLVKVAVTAFCSTLLVASIFSATQVVSSQNSLAVVSSKDKAIVTKNIKSVNEISSFLSAYDISTDIASTEVSKVTIPKTFDDTFLEFNETNKEAGFNLDKYKGKQVDKYMLLAPGKSLKDEVAFAVVLLYKNNIIGSYLLNKPSGVVTSLVE